MFKQTISRAITLGIRSESKNRWERRVPLIPDDVERLITDYGCKIIIQPSTKRVYPDFKYSDVGATVSSDLSKADFILGVKEVPTSELLDGKSYMFFSHTHKNQPHNRLMLSSILDKKIELYDYELLVNSKQNRLVQFSKFAGYAGFIDGLHSLGLRMLSLGYGNPFLAVGMSFMYRNVGDARLDITRTGMVIMDEGLPRELGPMVIVLTGNGNVSKGCLHMLKCLPCINVGASDLESLVKNKAFDNTKVYLCQVTTKDYTVDNDGNYDEMDYRSRPERYTSFFSEKIMPYATFIINGIFWTDSYPRLVTKAQLRQLQKGNKIRLLTLADISCDINGSFEFMNKASTIDEPFYMYDALTDTYHDDLKRPGVQIMSIDNLPTEMPLEASNFFSNSLYPIVAKIVSGSPNRIVEGARITTKEGKLEKKHEWLSKGLQSLQVSTSKKILLLGSGFVAKPLVDYLANNSQYYLTIASNTHQEALLLKKGKDNVKTAQLDVKDIATMETLIKNHDIVVSFIPAAFHTIVAKVCIAHGKDMLTASYISPEMKKLDQAAKQAGVTIMNEIGLDPGIDHLTAMETFDNVKNNGGVITSFISWCGGLPAPQASNNPLGYKFSWSPKGVLLAGLNSAKYKWDGKIVEIPGKDLFANVKKVSIFKGFAFEGLANRDSLSYIETYNLDPNVLQTMFRGTLRYQGYSSIMMMFSKLGFFDQKSIGRLSAGMSWKELTLKVAGLDINKKLMIAGLKVDESMLAALEEAMAFLEMRTDLPVPPQPSILDAFCQLLQSKLAYNTGESDMVAMHHEFGITKANGAKEVRSATMVDFGVPNGYTAMAKTVGLPAAIATDLMLRGHIKEKGVLAPLSKGIYTPILEELHKLGIKFAETTKTISPK